MGREGIGTNLKSINAMKENEENKTEFCSDTLPVTNWALSHTVNEPNRISIIVGMIDSTENGIAGIAIAI
jgi:hydrogenase maturation factor